MERGQHYRGQTWQQSSARGFPRAGDEARTQNVRMCLLAGQPNVCQLQEAKYWALSRTSEYLCAQLYQGKRVPGRSPCLVHEGPRKEAPRLCPQGRGRVVSLLLARQQHTEYLSRSGSHASGFAFPERGPALPGAGPWLPVPAARSMTGQALPWRLSARPTPPRPVHLPGGTPLRGAPGAGGQEARASALPPPVSRSWRGEEMASEQPCSCLIV